MLLNYNNILIGLIEFLIIKLNLKFGSLFKVILNISIYNLFYICFIHNVVYLFDLEIWEYFIQY